MKKRSKMLDKLHDKMECFFGFFGVIIAGIFVITAAFLTPGYNPIFNNVSDLLGGTAKSLFSIGFVIGGSLGIPFYIYLERKLTGINEIIRRIATGVSIFTCVCIALVAIGPEGAYPDLYMVFHGFVAFISFVGSVTYIGFFSILMIRDENTYFPKYYAYFGFIIVIVLGIYYLTLSLPLIQWTLTILILAWILLISTHLILH
ncbi:MAG: DUF998 domain-containing protein [Promethearchaeota archaeon]